MSMFTKITTDLPENNRYYNHSFALKNIRDSGSFYRIFQYEKETGNKVDNINKATLAILMKQNNISDSKFRNFIDDYYNWKITFYNNL